MLVQTQLGHYLYHPTLRTNFFTFQSNISMKGEDISILAYTMPDVAGNKSAPLSKNIVCILFTCKLLSFTWKIPEEISRRSMFFLQ